MNKDIIQRHFNLLNDIVKEMNKIILISNEIYLICEKSLSLDITENPGLIEYIDKLKDNQIVSFKQNGNVHENFLTTIAQTEFNKKVVIKKIKDLIKDYKGFYKELIIILDSELENSMNKELEKKKNTALIMKDFNPYERDGRTFISLENIVPRINDHLNIIIRPFSVELINNVNLLETYEKILRNNEDNVSEEMLLIGKKYIDLINSMKKTLEKMKND